MFTLCFGSPGFGPEVDCEMVIKARLLAASSLVPLYEPPAKQGRKNKRDLQCKSVLERSKEIFARS